MTEGAVEFTPAVRRRWCELLGLMYYPEWDDILGSPAREVAIFGGVRGSKSTVDALKVWFHPLFHAPGEALYWIVGGTYKAAEKEATYLYQWATMCGLVKPAGTSMPDRDSWRIVLANGTVIETRSSEHPERLASDAPDLILVVEAGQQKERVRKAARERALQRGAQIYYSGTFEDEDNHQTWKWFEDLDEEFEENNADHAKFSLPSWTNRHEFPAGEADPKIAWARENEDEYTFSRKYGGRPGGAQFAIYRAIQFNDDRLVPMPGHLRRKDSSSWITHIGGTDYGTVHPSALVVVSLSTDRVSLPGDNRGRRFEDHVAWVRECSWDGDRPEDSGERGDPKWLGAEKRRLQAAYPGLYRWITDPNERFMAKTWGGQAAATGAGSREVRIGMVRSRHVNGTLMYDRDGPGVERLYRESQAVRYKVMPDGQKVPLRLDDDQTAAKENAIWGIDTKPPAPPRSARTVRPAPVPAGRGSYPRV